MMTRYVLSSGDEYVGEVSETHGDMVTLRNYTVRYEDDNLPYLSPHPDDEVSFRIDAKTRVIKSGVQPSDGR